MGGARGRGGDRQRACGGHSNARCAGDAAAAGARRRRHGSLWLCRTQGRLYVPGAWGEACAAADAGAHARGPPATNALEVMRACS